MKHLSIIAASAASIAVAALSGCAVAVDYTQYISEKRSEIYLYKDDETDLKIYCVSREQPYNSDGICGDMCDLIEIFVSFPTTPESVEISLAGYAGELNYEAVDNRFTASYTSEAISSDGVDVTLTIDGKERNLRALNVADSSVISCEQALICTVEYDRQLFDSLTNKRQFAGEVYVRLLYDDGCYYYVGVCDREQNITAYLLDGGTGRVITSKKITA